MSAWLSPINWRFGMRIFVPTFISAMRLQYSALAFVRWFPFDLEAFPDLVVFTFPENL
jgi:hypothetical protein